MSYNPMMADAVEVRQRSLLTQVYLWMTAGLLVTGAVASVVAGSDAMIALILGNRLVFFGLLIAELALVWSFGRIINRVSSSVATLVFLGYAVLNGLTLSVIFLAYTQSSIASTFFITAGTFGAMSLYGYTTKRDLTSIGNLCVMALIGFLIASIVNIFLQSAALYWLTTYAGILIFVGLTAWDTQKLKALAANIGGDETQAHRLALLGALMLYLDFINLFLLMLRLFGRRR